MNNNHDLEQEFFTKVKGWEPEYIELSDEPTGRWYENAISIHSSLPPISTSWDAFNEWVVPELNGKITGIIGVYSYLAYSEKAENKLGHFILNDKTPQRALEWAMEELQS